MRYTVVVRARRSATLEAMTKNVRRRFKAGVFFDCERCGRLLRDCDEHHPTDQQCPDCLAPLRVVGVGNAMVEGAVWLRCLACKELFMRRRGELVHTRPRAGFETYS